LFRTPLLKSYSGRIVSRTRLRDDLGLGFFFIGVPLRAAGKAGTDDPNQVPAFDVHDHHQTVAIRLTDQYETRFADRMVGVRNRDGERISEGRCGLWEPDPCFRRLRQPSSDPK
jgi:hypothetical protein